MAPMKNPTNFKICLFFKKRRGGGGGGVSNFFWNPTLELGFFRLLVIFILI